jgi:hypothetical protein
MADREAGAGRSCLNCCRRDHDERGAGGVVTDNATGR